MLYLQNGERIVAIDSVTSLRPAMFRCRRRSLCAVHRRSVQPFAGSRSLPRGFQEGVHHSDGEEAWHGHDRRLIIPADLELASAVETSGAPRRPPAHGLPAVHRPAASQPERI